MISNRLQTAFDAFDRANSKDPNREVVNNAEIPGELLYAKRMTEWLDKFKPDASEPLKLAARCQHIERWVIPRKEYPMDRPGYLKWRNELKKYHADRAGNILRDAGYEDETIRRVQDLVMKKGIKSNPEAQTLEDVVCLVFLTWYFDEFAEKHDDDKLIKILQKTWRKMSKKGHDAALNLEMSGRAKRLLEQATGVPVPRQL
jgi:predicted transcriptional regulator